MANKTVKLTPPKTFHLLLELPLTDLMVPSISQYLDWKDLFNFRCCSRYCKEVAESAIAARRSVKIWPREPHEKPCGKMFFRLITKHCRRLREVELLGNLDWLTNEMLIALFNNNPLLEDVFLVYCKSLTAKALYPLAANCKKLTKLCLANIDCDDTLLDMLNQHEIHLKEVCLSNVPGFSEQGVCNFFRKQPHLESICLPALGSMLQQTLEILAESCKELKKLHVSDQEVSESVKELIKDMGVRW